MAAEMHLPTHPTQRHPLTGEPIRALWISPGGKICWPIMGGDDSVDPDDSGDGGQGDPDPSDGGKGFPANTPIAEMTAEQQAAYWQDKARKHEERNKAFGRLTPDELATLREKAGQHDALERELMSDKDKAVLEAREAATQTAREEYAPRLVRAEFKAAAANRIDAEKLAAILEPLDLTKFLDGGDVDEAKVAAYVDSIAPRAADPEDDEPPARRGPSASGAGKRTGSTGPSLQSGAELYRSGKRRG